MIKALFKHDVRSNWAVFAIIFGILLMYMSIIAMMYEPGSLDAMQMLLDSMPRQLISALGFDLIGTSLTGFLASYFYSFIIILFPMIYCLIVSGRLVSRYVDRRSMAYILSTPVSRVSVATTQAVFFLCSIAAIFAGNAIIGYLICEAQFPGELLVREYWLMNAMAFMMFMAVSAIAFFFSCIFDDIKLSQAFGSGVPLLFYVVSMLSKVDDKIAWLRNFTIFSLFDAVSIADGTASVGMNAAILAVMAMLGFAGGVVFFSRRDLAI